MNIPAISTLQMMEVDRLMIEDYGITLPQMMENAGSNLAKLAVNLLERFDAKRQITLLCGGGHNGGGGMVAARHLHNRGVIVKVALVAEQDSLKETTARQWRTIQIMGVPAAEFADLDGAGLIVDALIGYGIRGNPHGTIAEWIRSANRSDAPILSLDTPSGLDATSGTPGEPCIKAAATMTLALPKIGLREVSARKVVGDLYLADIGVPNELYNEIGIGIEVEPIFVNDTIIRI